MRFRINETFQHQLQCCCCLWHSHFSIIMCDDRSSRLTQFKYLMPVLRLFTKIQFKFYCSLMKCDKHKTRQMNLLTLVNCWWKYEMPVEWPAVDFVVSSMHHRLEDWEIDVLCLFNWCSVCATESSFKLCAFWTVIDWGFGYKPLINAKSTLNTKTSFLIRIW